MSFFGSLHTEKAGGLKEGEDFILVARDKTGVDKIRVANLANEKYCKRHGLIELVAFQTSKKHDNWLRFGYIHDRDNDLYYGIPSGYDDKGKLIWKPIIVADDAVFDLTKTNDAEIWAVLRNHYSVEGSPFAKGKPKYKVYDKEKEANLFLAKDGLRRNAMEIARGLYGENLLEMCRAAGKDVESMSAPIMSMTIIDFADKNPDKFLQIWDNPSRKELFTFKRGISVGIINYDPVMSAYMYNGVTLGTSEPQAVEYLRKNPPFCQTIEMFAQEKLTSSQKSMAEQKRTDDVKDAKDAEIERLKLQLEKMKQSPAATKPADEVDGEMKALQEKAKLLEIAGPHLYKSKEKLAQKIKEVEEKLLDATSPE